jgi:universal stress protein A
MHIRKILVAVDFSDSSETALDLAAKLASSMGGDVDLLHAWDVPVFLGPDAMIGYSATAQPLARHIAQQARQQMDACIQRAKERGISIHGSFVLEGNIAHTICEKAENGEYDLLVLGTRGRTGLSHLLLGSVAETVVRHSTVPVLTVRSPLPQKA